MDRQRPQWRSLLVLATLVSLACTDRGSALDASGESSSGGASDSTSGASTTTSTTEAPTGDPVASSSDDASTPVCGNGVMEAGEACDDGGESTRCNDDCTIAMCGDGLVNEAAGETCDDAGKSNACDDDCTVAECGDGIVNESAGEECDDFGESPTCNADCTPVACGDGVLNLSAGELCDDGDMGSCTSNCRPCIAFEEDFSDNSAGWTLGPEWEIGPALESTGHQPECGNPDPGSDHSPTADEGIAGVVIGGNAVQFPLHDFYYLTSPVIPTDGYLTLQLDLWRWLNSDYTRYMQNQIEVYNGSAWQILWQSGPSPGLQDSAWTPMTFDISAHANPDMQIRIGFNIDNTGALTCSQWNVDDIVVQTNDCG